MTTAPNNVVSIGATGEVVFTGLTEGALDIHVFSADGKSATSYLGVNTASIVDSTFTGSGSVVDIYVQVANGSVRGQSVFLETKNKCYQGTLFANSTGVTIGLYDQPPGTAISGTLYLGQGAPLSAAGNPISASAEVLNLGSYNFVTTATSGIAQVNSTANFSALTPVAPTLVTLSGVTPPTGLSVEYASFGCSASLGSGFGGPLTLPDTISGALVGNNQSWSVTASTLSSKWVSTGTYAVGDTLSVNASLTMPSMVADQAGSAFSWMNIPEVHSFNLVTIHELGSGYTWKVYTPSNTNSITLPAAPLGMTGPLTTGKSYQVDVAAVKEAVPTTYEQALAVFAAGSYYHFKGEWTSIVNVPYIR